MIYPVLFTKKIFRRFTVVVVKDIEFAAQAASCQESVPATRPLAPVIVVRVSRSAGRATLPQTVQCEAHVHTTSLVLHSSSRLFGQPATPISHSENPSTHVLQFLKLFDYLRLSSTRLPSVPFTFSDPSHRCPDATIRRVQTSPNFRYLKATSNLHTLGFAQRIPHVAQLG